MMSAGRATLRIGTRGSRLARWQANWVVEQIHHVDPDLKVELVEIQTQGDRDRNSPLAVIGGMGLFTKEIQRAVQEGLVDGAVHSLKDLPAQEPAELILAAVPGREDVADALFAPVHRTLEGLPRSARVGTSSPRRQAQLLFLRPDLKVVTLRGNLETRLNQVLQGRLDAVVLACAGLQRLGLQDYVTQRLPPLEFLPAAGQGALGVECRRGDATTLAVLRRIDDPVARRSVAAERAVLAALKVGCAAPVGVWARDVNDGQIVCDEPLLALDAAVYAPDGRARVTAALRGPRNDPDGLGLRVSQVLRERGAAVFPSGLF
jgi:hydroxymethylbilane synthase